MISLLATTIILSLLILTKTFSMCIFLNFIFYTIPFFFYGSFSLLITNIFVKYNILEYKVLKAREKCIWKHSPLLSPIFKNFDFFIIEILILRKLLIDKRLYIFIDCSVLYHRIIVSDMKQVR